MLITASDRKALIRLASSLAKGSSERREILSALSRVSMEHASEDALKKYLKEHPKADPKNHTVEGEKGKKPSEGLSKKLSQWVEKAKGLTAKAKKKIESLDEASTKFVVDKEYRDETMKKAGEALKAAPKKYAKEVLHHFEHEVKEVGSGLARMSKGELPSPSERKAMAGLAIEVAVAALTIKTAGAVGVGVTLGKSLAKHLALSAINPLLGDAYVFGLELSHLLHGVEAAIHVAAEKGTTDPEKFVEDLVVAVADAMEKGLSNEDLIKALNEDYE